MSIEHLPAQSTGKRAIPYPVLCRHMSKRDLERAFDDIMTEQRQALARGDQARVESTERRLAIVGEELDRRDEQRQAREQKRQQRIRREADAWYEAQEGGR